MGGRKRTNWKWRKLNKFEIMKKNSLKCEMELSDIEKLSLGTNGEFNTVEDL